MVRYRARPAFVEGGRLILTDEQIARIYALADAEGHLTAGRIVADAKDQSSPLRDLFLWDASTNSEALDQARKVIRSVTVLMIVERGLA